MQSSQPAMSSSAPSHMSTSPSTANSSVGANVSQSGQREPWPSVSLATRLLPFAPATRVSASWHYASSWMRSQGTSSPPTWVDATATSIVPSRTSYPSEQLKAAHLTTAPLRTIAFHLRNKDQPPLPSLPLNPCTLILVQGLVARKAKVLPARYFSNSLNSLGARVHVSLASVSP